MKIPRQITIHGHKWKIAYKWNLRLGDENSRVDRCDGLCDLEAKTIFLDRGLTEDERPKVFMHELLHAIIFEANLHHAESLSEEVEEILVETIGRFLIDKFHMRLKRSK